MFKRIIINENGDQETIANPRAGEVGQPERLPAVRAIGVRGYKQNQLIAESRVPVGVTIKEQAYEPEAPPTLDQQIASLDQMYREAAYGQAEANGFDQMTLLAIKENREDGLLNPAQISRHDAIKNFARAVWGMPGMPGAYYTRKDELRAGSLDLDLLDIAGDHPWTLGNTEDFWKLV